MKEKTIEIDVGGNVKVRTGLDGQVIERTWKQSAPFQVYFNAFTNKYFFVDNYDETTDTATGFLVGVPDKLMKMFRKDFYAFTEKRFSERDYKEVSEDEAMQVLLRYIGVAELSIVQENRIKEKAIEFVERMRNGLFAGGSCFNKFPLIAETKIVGQDNIKDE